MPFFPELLYQLSPRDQQVTWLDPIVRTVSASAALLAVAARFTVPVGQALVLQAASVRAQAGAAQNVNDVILNITTQDLVRFGLKRELSIINANPQRADWSGSIIVPPDHTVEGLGNFSAAAAANSIELNIHGILIPIGNIQRV